MIVAKDIHLWRTDPVRTEEMCYFSLLGSLENSTDALYLAFPWAVYLNLRGSLNPPLIPTRYENLPVFTVCQHIRYREIIPILLELGVKVLFTPHACESEKIISGIQILGFPHYPSNFYKSDLKHGPLPRKFLYSMVGADTAPVRQAIDRFASEESFVKLREKWHFQQSADQQREERQEYLKSLKDSAFILCPRGTGPSSLRIWEALVSARIPVILADDLLLPEGIDWESCSLKITEDAVETLPSQLRDLSAEVRLKLESKAALVGQEILGNFSFTVFHWLRSQKEGGVDPLPTSNS